MDSPSLASLSLTHVHYDPADPVSHACAYLALVPQALVITYVALIWSTREVEILLMFAGQMGCEAFNWLLKRTIKEQRPPRAYIAFMFTFISNPKPGRSYAVLKLTARLYRDARERIRHAFLSCPICGILFCLLDSVPALPA